MLMNTYTTEIAARYEQEDLLRQAKQERLARSVRGGRAEDRGRQGTLLVSGIGAIGLIIWSWLQQSVSR